jgi:K+-transporting ATPase ATPase B chain
MTKKPSPDVGLFAPDIIRPALVQSFVKLDPRSLARNPVMFATALVSVLATILTIREGLAGGATFWIGLQITIWLWFTVLFANFAEAVAEGRGKARADAFRATKSSGKARLLLNPPDHELFEMQDVELLEPGEVILVKAGDLIPADGEIISGVVNPRP